MVTYVPVTEGNYAGKTAMMFESDSELRAYVGSSMIPDDTLVGIPRSLYFEHYPTAPVPQDGGNYALAWSAETANVSLGALTSHDWAVGGRPFSFHELPDPGWKVIPRPDINAMEIVSPEGVHLVWYLVVAILMMFAVFAYLIVDAFLGSVRSFFSCETEQLSANIAIVNCLSGSTKIDKNTGAQSPVGPDWMLYMLVGGAIIAAVIIAEYALTKKSTIVDTFAGGARATYRAGKTVYHKVAD